MGFKSGFVAVVGRTNVGKSTFINNVIGEKISIISNKPQTTRNNIQAVLTKDDFQIVFIDTPGFHKPQNKLDSFMINCAENAFKGVDVVLLLIEATESGIGKGDVFIIEQLKGIKVPVILLINKIDLIEKEKILPTINKYKDLMNFAEIIPVSALKKDGVNNVINMVVKKLPNGPKYFPDDMITDQPERHLVAELIREKLLRNLSDEIPHGVGIEITLFKERSNGKIIDIDANIYCDKDSHKKIIIGKNGEVLKKIGSLARGDIEKLLAEKVFLQLWVKVKKDWRNSMNMLKTLGYK